MFPPMNRREMLRLAGAGLALAPMAPLQALAQTATGGYRALVCLFLYGGNDSNNLIVPTDTTPYGVYRATRPNLAIAREQLLPLAPTNTGGATYGLHPAMPGLQQLFSAGKAAFVANVGPLMVPTSKTQWSQRSVPLPMNLFSHSDQQGIWQSAIAAENARHGWGGRLLERLIADNAPRRGYAALSVAGNNTWEAGDRTLQAYRISALGEFGFSFFDPEGTDILSMEINAMLGEQRADPFEQTWIDVMSRSVENQKVVSNAIGGLNLATAFPNTGLGRQLQTIARLIGARSGMGLQKQCFFCSIGGFDTHGDDQLQQQRPGHRPRLGQPPVRGGRRGARRPDPGHLQRPDPGWPGRRGQQRRLDPDHRGRPVRGRPGPLVRCQRDGAARGLHAPVLLQPDDRADGLSPVQAAGAAGARSAARSTRSSKTKQWPRQCGAPRVCSK